MVLDKKSYVDKAENVILTLKKQKKTNGKPKELVTISKLRNLLAMSADIYNIILDEDEILNDEICSRIEYLKIRFIYECGRDRDVKAFIETAQLIQIIKEINNSREQYILFMHYMEALVAFHRYNGGKD